MLAQTISVFSTETKWKHTGLTALSFRGNGVIPNKHLLFVFQGRSIQMEHQTGWKRMTLFLREAATPTAGRSKRSLPPQMTMPTAWPGSTTPTWTPPGRSPQDLSGLCSPARKVWSDVTTCYLILLILHQKKCFSERICVLLVGWPICTPNQAK